MAIICCTGNKRKLIFINKKIYLFHMKWKRVLTCLSFHEWDTLLVSYEEEWCGTWLDTHARTHTVSLHAVLSTNVPGTSVCGFSCMFCPLLFSQHQYLWELQHIFPLKNSKAWICHQHLFGLCYMQRLTLKTKI